MAEWQVYDEIGVAWVTMGVGYPYDVCGEDKLSNYLYYHFCATNI